MKGVIKMKRCFTAIAFFSIVLFRIGPLFAAVGWVDDGTVVRLETSTDDVGIGTTTPGAKLHVSGGDILLDNSRYLEGKSTTGAALRLFYLDSGNNTEIWAGSGGLIRFFDSAGANERVQFDTTAGIVSLGDRVGIGTFNPVSGMKLNVVGRSQFEVTGTGSVPVEIQMTNTGLSRPGFLLCQNNDAAANGIGSTVTHYGVGRVQQGGYSFSWTGNTTTDAQWEMWLRTNNDSLVVAKAVPEGTGTGNAFFRFGPDTQTPLDRVHLINGNLRLQRSSAAQRVGFYEGLTQDWVIEHNSDRSLKIDSPGQRILALNQTGGNVGIGTTNPTGSTTAGAMVLAIGDGTAPVGGRDMMAMFYADTVGTTTEMYVMDEAGNSTRISPHDPETGEWVFYSKNTKTGRVVQIDMEKLVKKVEELSGEKFMTEKWE